MEERTTGLYSGLANGQPKLIKMALLSFFVHAILISIAIAAPSFLKKKRDFHPIYMVQLVSPSELGIRSSPPKVRKGVKKPVRKKVSPTYKDNMETSVVRKRAQIGGPRPVVLPNKKLVAPVKRDWGAEIKEVKKKIEKMEKQEKEPEEVQEAAPPTRSAHSAWRAQSTLLIEYSLVVKERVKEGWSFPSTGETLEAIVSLQVDKDGKIEDIQFERMSDNPQFDESILRALRKTILPPPPQGIIGEVFVITFHNT
jgi:TonB family protein